MSFSVFLAGRKQNKQQKMASKINNVVKCNGTFYALFYHKEGSDFNPYVFKRCLLHQPTFKGRLGKRKRIMPGLAVLIFKVSKLFFKRLCLRYYWPALIQY